MVFTLSMGGPARTFAKALNVCRNNPHKARMCWASIDDIKKKYNIEHRAQAQRPSTQTTVMRMERLCEVTFLNLLLYNPVSVQ